MTIVSPDPLAPVYNLFFGLAQHVLERLVDSGYDKASDAYRQITQADQRELKKAFERAWAQASIGKYDERLKSLLEHKPFQDAVVVGLLDPIEGFDVAAASEGWTEKYPQYERDLKTFFRNLEKLLLKDDHWGSELTAAREHTEPEAQDKLEHSGMVINIQELVAQQNVYNSYTFVQSGGVIAQDNAQVHFHYHLENAAPGMGSQIGSGETDGGMREYLEWVFRQTSKLSLEGINLRDAGEKDARLNLQAIYTALLTLTPEEYDRMERVSGGEREARRQSALEVLNQHKHLVLLGDPGSGKSTFVDFVALCLTGEMLGNEEVNLSLLTAPMPDDEGKDQKKQQPWDHGALLPVRIILREFAARGLHGKGQELKLQHLWDFLEGDLTRDGMKEYSPVILRQLKERGGLLLFDGLDEVPEASQRREQIIKLVESAAEFPNFRVLVTSRIYAYRAQDWKVSGFSTAVLDSFSTGQIRRFVDHWYASLAQLGAVSSVAEAQRRAVQLKYSIFSNPNILALAQRPLLLTLMAGLHSWRGGTLPEKRELLYHESVELLLDRWQRRKVMRLPDGKEEKQPSLEEFLRVGKDNVRRALEELAFEVHSRQPKEQTGTADIPEKDLVYALLSASPVQEQTRPELLKRYLRERVGLLLARGDKIYAFPHRTFQEYLAACHLTNIDFPDLAAELACADPERWREVTLLAGAKAARGSDNYWNLAHALCCETQPPVGVEASEPQLWGAFLAGQMLAESADLRRLSRRKETILERVRKWLVYILQSGSLPVTDRAAAGDNLALLGDPRFDPEHWFLPRSNALALGDPHPDFLGFVPIPAGSFLMGSRLEEDGHPDDYRQHQLELPDYYLGRVPVTVAQFRSYVTAAQPHLQGNPDLDAPANHPVVTITWNEALAYCGWLEGRLREMGQERLTEPSELCTEELLFWRRLLNEGWRVTLPSEAEWEKAARGPLAPPPYPPAYPCGPDFGPDCANLKETGLRTTSAVGCFPRDRGAYGPLDLTGNVREWTRSHFMSYHRLLRLHHYLPWDGREAIGAGNHVACITRGSSYDDDLRFATYTDRNGVSPECFALHDGFRVAVVSHIFVWERRNLWLLFQHPNKARQRPGR